MDKKWQKKKYMDKKVAKYRKVRERNRHTDRSTTETDERHTH